MKILFAFLLLFIGNTFAQNDPIIVNGDYRDWESVDLLHTDPSFDNASGSIDFRKLKVTNNNDFLFIDIGVGGEVVLLEERNITLYIDTDNNSSTGLQYAGIGAELVFEFGNKQGKFYYDGKSLAINHSDIDLYPQPTVTSDRFEFAINRNITLAGKSLFPGDVIKIVLKDKGSGADRLPDSDGGVTYTFENKSFNSLPEFSISKNNSNDLRIMSYNIEQDGLFRSANKEEYKRIFNAIKPDIIGFQEIYDNSSQKTADLIAEFLTTSGGQWYHSKPDYDVVLVSRYQIKETFAISPKAGHSGDYKQMDAFLLDLRPKYNKDLLLINAHPKCCSGDDNDEERQNMCDAIMEFIREAKKSGGKLTLDNKTPIVILGDMNFVGDKHQPETIKTGNIKNNNDYGSDFKPDWNYQYLIDSNPLVTNLPVTNSTNNPDSEYPPGRLDYLFFTGSVMEAVNSYILYTPALNSSQLSQAGLEAKDTEVSDHLPLVVDFDMDGVTDVKKESMGINKFQLQQNYPNPFNPNTVIKYQLSDVSYVRLKIFDILGNEVATLVDEEKASGSYAVNFDASNLTSGVYFYKLQVRGTVETKKMLLLR